MNEQVGNFNRHMEIKKNIMKMVAMKNMLTEKKISTVGLSSLDIAVEKTGELKIKPVEII